MSITHADANTGAVFLPTHLWNELYGYLVTDWAHQVPTNFTYEDEYGEHLIVLEETPYWHFSLATQRELIEEWRTNPEAARHAKIQDLLPPDGIHEVAVRLAGEAGADWEMVLSLASNWQGSWPELLEVCLLTSR